MQDDTNPLASPTDVGIDTQLTAEANLFKALRATFLPDMKAEDILVMSYPQRSTTPSADPIYANVPLHYDLSGRRMENHYTVGGTATIFIKGTQEKHLDNDTVDKIGRALAKVTGVSTVYRSTDSWNGKADNIISYGGSIEKLAAMDADALIAAFQAEMPFHQTKIGHRRTAAAASDNGKHQL